MSIAYAANIGIFTFLREYHDRDFFLYAYFCKSEQHLLTSSAGGTGVVTGSPPNLVVPEILNKVEKLKSQRNFGF